MKSLKNKKLPMFIHGIDVVNLNRPEFKTAKLVTKLLHSKEIEHYKTLTKVEQAKYLAVIWAIKEAIYKALNTAVVYPDLYIFKEHDQYQCLHSDYIFVISVSYCDQYLFASVIGNKKH